MTNTAPAELASFIDALGHQVTVVVAPSGLLVILTRTADEGLRDGHPALNVENAIELRDALMEFIDGQLTAFVDGEEP
jgi:hypothetical protein